MKKLLTLLLLTSPLLAGHFVKKSTFERGQNKHAELLEPREAAQDYFKQIKNRNNFSYRILAHANLGGKTLKATNYLTKSQQMNTTWFQYLPLTETARTRYYDEMRKIRKFRTNKRNGIGFRTIPTTRNLIIPDLMDILRKRTEADFKQNVLPYMTQKEIVYYFWKKAN